MYVLRMFSDLLSLLQRAQFTARRRPKRKESSNRRPLFATGRGGSHGGYQLFPRSYRRRGFRRGPLFDIDVAAVDRLVNNTRGYGIEVCAKRPVHFLELRPENLIDERGRHF